jgi:hypothetical protein
MLLDRKALPPDRKAEPKRDISARIIPPWQAEGQRARSADLCLEEYLSSFRARLDFINYAFCELEAAFLKERECADNPELTHDRLMLQICRNKLAAELKQCFPTLKAWIKKRAYMSIVLPELPSKPKSVLDEVIEEVLSEQDPR